LTQKGARQPERIRDGNFLFDSEHLFIRYGGQWVAIGRVDDTVREIADEEIAAAPRAPRADIMRSIPVRLTRGQVENAIVEFGFDYENGNPPRKFFKFRFFASLTAWQAGKPEMTEVSGRPEIVEVIPPTPVQEAGEHKGRLRLSLPNAIESTTIYLRAEVVNEL